MELLVAINPRSPPQACIGIDRAALTRDSPLATLDRKTRSRRSKSVALCTLPIFQVWVVPAVAETQES